MCVVFFPEGESTRGKLSSCHAVVGVNTAENPLPKTFTIGDYVKKMKTHSLRFRLFTKPKTNQELLLETMLDEDSDNDFIPSSGSATITTNSAINTNTIPINTDTNAHYMMDFDSLQFPNLLPVSSTDSSITIVSEQPWQSSFLSSTRESVCENLPMQQLSTPDQRLSQVFATTPNRHNLSQHIPSPAQSISVTASHNHTQYYPTPSVDVTTNTYPCEICGCTRTRNTCLRCEQNYNYMSTLMQDQTRDADTETSDADAETADAGAETADADAETADADAETVDDVHDVRDTTRSARLRYFLRDTNRAPCRLRHSIGSPSLSLATQTTHEAANPSTPAEFGDNECDAFLAVQEEDHWSNSSADVSPDTNTITELLEELRDDYTTHISLLETKSIVVQRARFWDRLLKQNIDVMTRVLRIIFAGEAGADNGGPLRKFLTLFCRNFNEVPGLVFGSSTNVFFKMLPLSLQSKHYYLLGQICAVAILIIGRGPECLNETVFNTLYHMPLQKGVIEDENQELLHMIRRLEGGDADILLDNDIPLYLMDDITKCTELVSYNFLINMNLAAIEQFGRGLASVAPKLLLQENHAVLRTFLVIQPKRKMTLDEFRVVIKFVNPNENGSNESNKVQDLICDTEQFFADLSDGNFEFDGHIFQLEDILLMFTGVERIPPFGLGQMIGITLFRSYSHLYVWVHSNASNAGYSNIFSLSPQVWWGFWKCLSNF